MGCFAALPVLLLAGLLSALAQDSVTITDYSRPPASPDLPMAHERLFRGAGASPHVPEQVHLTLAGPGAMAISWLTYPQVDFMHYYVCAYQYSPSCDLDINSGVVAVTAIFEWLRPAATQTPIASSQFSWMKEAITLCLLHL